jgi:hypothetical protein
MKDTTMRAPALPLQGTLSIVGLLAGLSACGNPSNMGTDAPVLPVEDTGTVDTCGPPTLGAEDSFGTSVGTYFDDVTIPRCDGTPYTFYNDDFCADSHRLTVVSIAALWCVPCQEESAQMTDRITNAYADQGVRVIQIIVDGTPIGSTFTPTQCQQWVDAYGLVNVELMDVVDGVAGTIIGERFPSGSLPSTLLVDARGRIVYREDGAAPGLNTLRAAIEAHLSGS